MHILSIPKFYLSETWAKWARHAASLDFRSIIGARAFGLGGAHHITEDEFWRAVPLVQWHMDEPSADPSAVALYFVDRLAARRVKAVLSGEGADEFFGGYRVYQAPLENAHLERVPKGLLRAESKMLRAAGKRGANYLERASRRVEDWYYTNAPVAAFSGCAGE